MDLLPEREAKARTAYALAATQKELKDNPEFARKAERLIDGYYQAMAKEGNLPSVRVFGTITEEFVAYFQQRLRSQGYTSTLTASSVYNTRNMLAIAKLDQTHMDQPLKYGTFRRDPYFASPWLAIHLDDDLRPPPPQGSSEPGPGLWPLSETESNGLQVHPP